MMPHVDEGTLHALLDGALRAEDPAMATEVESHLAECEDCRARLETAAELRRDAGNVLDASAPGRAAAIPPFAAVRARAEARADDAESGLQPAHDQEGFRPVRRHARVREIEWIRRLSWAATLVIALGTGYLIRGLVEPPGDGSALAVDRERPASLETGGAAQDEATAAEPGVERRAMAGASSSPDAEGAASPPAARQAAAAEPAETASRAATPAPGGADGPRAATASNLPVSSASVGEQGRNRVVVREGGATIQPDARDSAGPVAADAGEGVSAALPDGAAAGRWTAATPAEVRAALGGPLYLLPKATLVEVYLRVEAEPAEALSLQELGSGVAVTVVQRRVPVEAGEPDGQEGAVASAEAARGDMAASRAPRPRQSFAALPPPAKATAVVDGFVLEVTGSVPVELLAILAGAARPVP